MPRGGRRSGTPGKTYGNRTDLNNNVRALPVAAAPSGEYGQGQALQDAQSAVPMASGDLSTQPAPMSHQDLLQQASDYNPPPVIPLGAPTMRPTEGLMTPPAPQPQASPLLLQGVALLNSLGDEASPEVKALRRIVNAGQQNAAAP